MSPKVLLLGPKGQLGHDVRRAHAEAGEPFDLLVLPRERLDVALPAAVESILDGADFSALVNCSAYTRVDEAEHDAGPAFAVNARAVRAMARVCAAKGARLVHVSTDYVFGGGARDRPLREDDPMAPVNVYGASKAMGETLARLASDDVVILRVASLFGVAGVGGAGGNFVETVIRAGKEKGSLRVVDDQVMSPTASADVAGVIVRILREGCPAGLYHVVNAGSATWYEFAREIVCRAGVEATVTPCASAEFPAPAARPRYSALDNAKAAAAFGTMRPWQEALDRYLRARGHPRGRRPEGGSRAAQSAPRPE